MQQKPSSLMLGLCAAVALALPLSALADKGRSKSSSHSESRGHNESHSESRGESHSRSDSSRSGTTLAGTNASASGAGTRQRHDEEHHAEGHHEEGHERGERRSEWSEANHRAHVAGTGTGTGTATRPAMTPEALALIQQARQAAYEYRVSGSAESLAALQTLRTTLESMGFVRTPHVPSTSTAPTTVATTPVVDPGNPPATSGPVTQ